MLDKHGNRNSDERTDLLERFDRIFPNAQIHCLTGDREFVGREWCSFLLVPDAMPFRLRLRHLDRISARSGKQRQKGERVFVNLKGASRDALRVSAGSGADESTSSRLVWRMATS